MSNYEINKGVLTPFKMTEEYGEKLVKLRGEKLEYDSYMEQVADDCSWYDERLCEVNGEYYTVEFEIEAGSGLDSFAEVSKNEDGTINFHTYHYNGGAYWTEVIGHALELEELKNE